MMLLVMLALSFLAFCVTTIECKKQRVDTIDLPFQEYLFHLYGNAEDYGALTKIYPVIKETDSKLTERLLDKYVKDKNTRQQIVDGTIPYYQKDGVLSMIPGVKSEWPAPTSKLASHCLFGRKLLETRNWKALEILLLDEIITDPDYKSSMLPRKLMVAGGMALLDFRDKYPNCIAPWKVDENGKTYLTVGKRAKVLAIILKIRAKRLIIGDPKTACQDIDITHDMALCVRVLVAGGYSRADELLDLVKDYDQLTLIAGCFHLERYGPKAARKYFQSRNLPAAENSRELINSLEDALSPLEGWHVAAKQLSLFCPCRHTELPIYARVHRLHSLVKDKQVQIKNTEKMFWVLVAAQYKDMAREMLDRLTKLLESEVFGEIKKKMEMKIRNDLESMEKVWLKTEAVTMEHVAEYSDTIMSIIEALVEGSLTIAISKQSDILSATVKSAKYPNAFDHPTNRFVQLLIGGFRNPQLLNPLSGKVLRYNDWEYNWYIAQAVEKYMDGAKFIQLVDHTVSEDIFNSQQALILFFAGRFHDLIEMSKKTKVSDRIIRAAYLCSMKRDDVCTFPSIAGNDRVSDLSQTVPSFLCQAVKNAASGKAVNDPIFELSNAGMQVFDRVSAKKYLLPPLPGDLELPPLDTMSIVRILNPPLTLDIDRQKEMEQSKKRVFEAVSQQVAMAKKISTVSKAHLIEITERVLHWLGSSKGLKKLTINPEYRSAIQIIAAKVEGHRHDFNSKLSNGLKNFDEFSRKCKDLGGKNDELDVDRSLVKDLGKFFKRYKRFLTEKSK